MKIKGLAHLATVCQQLPATVENIKSFFFSVEIFKLGYLMSVDTFPCF